MMRTLESLLRDRHGFVADDFGPERAEVRFDVRTGAIGRWPGSHVGRTGKPAVAVREFVGEGQSLSFLPTPTLGRRVTVYVLAVNEDGLVALSWAGAVGFLPWQMLAYGLSHTATVEIEADDADAPDAPAAGRRALREEIVWLQAESLLHTRLAAVAAARIEDLRAELAADDLNRSLNG